MIISLSKYGATAQCTMPIDPDICIEDGDLFIEGSCHGVVLTSPDGSCFRVSVNNDGSLSTVAIIATDAGPDQEICADNPQILLNGTLGDGVLSATWTGGTGTFSPNRSSLKAVYTLSASEISTGFVNLTLSPDNVLSSCDGNDVVSITILPEVIVNAGADITLCEDDATIQLTGTVNSSTGSGVWLGGQGAFVPNRNALNAMYTPTQAEKSSGTVTLTLRSTGISGVCPIVEDQIGIIITPSIAINAGPDQIVCHEQTALLIPSPTGGTWSGGTGTFNGNTYLPSPSEIGTTVNLTYSVQAIHNNCISGSDELSITVFSEPFVNLVNDISLCSGEQVQQTIFTGTPGTSFLWTNSHPNIGLPSSGFANIPAFTVNNSTASTIIATITVTPYNFGPNGVDNSGNGDDCIGTAMTFTISVESNGSGSLFSCLKVVQFIEDVNPPSTTFNVFDIVDIIGANTCTGMPTLTAAFSQDPTDTLRTYGCVNVGDVQVTTFIFDIGDSNNDGVIDTTFREACFTLQTVLDPSGFCRP